MPSSWREPRCGIGSEEGENSFLHFLFVYTGFGVFFGPFQKHLTKRHHTMDKKWGYTWARHDQDSVKEHNKDHSNSHVDPKVFCSVFRARAVLIYTVYRQDTKDKQVICPQVLHLCC